MSRGRVVSDLCKLAEGIQNILLYLQLMLHQLWCQPILCLAAHFHHLPVNTHQHKQRERVRSVKSAHIYPSLSLLGDDERPSVSGVITPSSWQNIIHTRTQTLFLCPQSMNEKLNQATVMSSFLVVQKPGALSGLVTSLYSSSLSLRSWIRVFDHNFSTLPSLFSDRHMAVV